MFRGREATMTRPVVIALALGLLYVALALAGLCWGAEFISPTEVWQSFFGEGNKTTALIVNRIRLPQVLLLGLVGAALACSGASLQATFDNPLADPGVLGVSAGASFAALLVSHLDLTKNVFLALPVAAFLGALAVALLVYGL